MFKVGMFDEILDKSGDFKCSECFEVLTEFQSKSGGCSLEVLSVGELLLQSNPATIYTSCPRCDKWNEFRVSRPTHPMMRIQRINNG